MPSIADYATYQPPPPPPRRAADIGWLWTAIVVGVVIVIAVTAALVIVGTHATKDSDDVIDNGRILKVVKTECARMTKVVDSLTVTGSIHQQAQIIYRQNDAVDRMVRAVRSLDPALLRSDRPTIQWTNDWERLMSVRTRFAQELEHGDYPQLHEPLDSQGRPVLERMNRASSPDCVVPEGLLDPYPQDVESI